MKINAYAVFYGNIIAGLYKQPSCFALFCSENKAAEFAAEMNEIKNGYRVEKVEIKLLKRVKGIK
jgi:hypothetical protein